MDSNEKEPESLKSKNLRIPHKKLSLPHKTWAFDLDVDRMSKNVAVVSDDGRLLVYSIAEETKIVEQKFQDVSYKIRIYPSDDNMIIMGARSKAIRLFDLRSNRVETLIFAKEPVESLAVSFDGSLIAAGQVAGFDANLDIWDTRYLGRECKNYTPTFKYGSLHSEDITALNFSPQERSILATGSTDGLINIIDLDNFNPDEEEASILWTSKYDSINDFCWFGVNSDYLLASTHNEESAIYDATSGKQLRRNYQLVDEEEGCFKDIIKCYNAVPGQNLMHIIALDGKNNMDVYEITLSSVTNVLKIHNPTSSSVRCVQFYNKGHNLISAANDESFLLLWSMS